MTEKTIKLLGIVGSPRKGGNTEIAVGEALKVAEQEGAETEMIHLADYDLKPCMIYDVCNMSCHETKKCVIEDDVEKLYEKVLEADGIIIGSPIHYYNMSVPTKIFIDRVGALNGLRNRVASRNKVGGAIGVASRSGSKISLAQILLFYQHERMIIASPVVTVIAGRLARPVSGEPARYEKDALRDTRGINEARELAKSMVQIAKATASLRGT